MYAANDYNSTLQQRLLAALDAIPTDWVLTPVLDNKHPYLKEWQVRVVSRTYIAGEIKRSKAKGFGLICGRLSGGLLAVDADGEAAHQLLQELGEMPKTVAFTSGKLGRCQYLLKVPQEYWDVCNTVKIDTLEKNDDGKPQLLEFRWDRHVSVLPPSVHPETGEYKWVIKFDECEIATAPNWVIEKITNKSTSPNVNYKDIQLPVQERIPLIECLAKETRYALNTSSATGGRNNTGAMLARDLLGTANYLDSLGQQYDGNPSDILWSWCVAVGLDTDKPKNQFEQIWESAEKSIPTPSCGADGVDNCIRGWYWREYINPNKNSKPKVIRHPASKPISDTEVLDKIQDLVSAELSKPQLYLKFNEIAASTGLTPLFVEKLYKECRKDSLLLEENSSLPEEIDELIEASVHRFDIASVLPVALAEPIKQLATTLNLRPETYFTALLSTVSSLHHSETRVHLIDKTDFNVTPNLFAAMVAVSSQKKTPIFNAIVTNPLTVLQDKIDLEYEQILLEYQELIKEYESLKKEERASKFPNGAPIEPRLRILWFDRATGEGLVEQIKAFPHKGILWASDELAGIFKAQNAYRGGRGSDEEEILAYYNGGGAISLRATKKGAKIKNILLAIFGNIQPDVLADLMGDFRDSNGKWARFIFVIQPKSACEILEDGPPLNLTPLLANLYECIDAIPSRLYQLAPEAKSYFLKYYSATQRKYNETSHPGLSIIYGKAAGYAGKILLNLHVIKHAFNNEVVPDVIDLETVKAAVQVTKFYLSQAKLIYAQFSEENSLPYHLSRVITICEKKPNYTWTAREIIKGFPKIIQLNGKQTKLRSEIVRQWFRELEKLGFGATQGTGKQLTFTIAECAEQLPNTVRHTQSQDI